MSGVDFPSKRDRQADTDTGPAAKQAKIDLLANDVPKMWRKYGEKTPSIGAGRLRKTYFKCTVDDCPARKTVLRWPEQTVEEGQHEFLVDHDAVVHLSRGQQLPSTLPRAGQVAGSAEDPGTGLNHDYTSGNKNFDGSLRQAPPQAMAQLPLEPAAARPVWSALVQGRAQAANNRPRRAPGPFILWQTEHRQMLKQQQPHLGSQ